MDQTRLLTREALIAHRSLFEARTQRELLWLGVSAIPLLVMLIVITMIALEEEAVSRESPLWSRWLCGVSLGSVGVGAIWFIYRMSQSELTLKCPSCRTALGNPTTLFPVIATSRCPKCEQVIVGAFNSMFDPLIGVHPERQESRRILWITTRWEWLELFGACWQNGNGIIGFWPLKPMSERWPALSSECWYSCLAS